MRGPQKTLVDHPTQLRNWVKQFAAIRNMHSPAKARWSLSSWKIARLKREVAKLKAKRDNKKLSRAVARLCGVETPLC
jgi:hypothetical protein